MKLDIVGASNFVNRMFEACGPFQWARELLKNSLEAGASRVEFGIEWQAVESEGVYRRIVMDDGCGMDRGELLRFFSTLGDGSKKIGGVHDNFGVGAKIAALPWNPDGLVVVSYKGGKATMIWIVLDPDSGDYELKEFETDSGRYCAIDPSEYNWEEVDWSKLRPEWLEDHGTVVVLLGSEQHPDTVLGNPQAGEDDIKGLSVFLNTRFWDLSGPEIIVQELRSAKKSKWPTGPDDRDDARRTNNRRIQGAQYYLAQVKSSKGNLSAQGSLFLDQERVVADWYLWEGDRPAIHSYAKKGGYIAVRYRDELFQVSTKKVHFRWFGVIESKVQQSLTLILEPQESVRTNGRWGIHPDQSRNRLIFTGSGEVGADLPMPDWGLEFAENMPEEVLAAIREARGDLTASLEDERYRERLQNKFGDRWSMKALVSAEKADRGKKVTSTVTTHDVEVLEQPEPQRQVSRRKRRKTMKVTRKRALEGGPDSGIEMTVPVDVPHIRFGSADEFDTPWHLALWAPNAPEGAAVVINVDSPILQEAVTYHQEQYPEVFAEEVAKTVRQVFGEIAACKVAHSQQLTDKLSEEQLDQDYRSEAALTVALMGLLAEESLIAQRLGKLGRKKPAA